MRINRHTLFGALKELNKVANHKAALPITSTVLLKTNNGILTLTTTDLDQVLQAQIPAEGELHTCLPCKLLTTLVKPEKKSDAGDAILEAMPDNKVATSIDGISTKLISLDPADFPTGFSSSEQDWSIKNVWPAKPLLEGLSYILPASSKDETRHNLCSVYFNCENLVTTDGHRLHQAALPTPLPEPILMPASVATTLKRILPGADQVILAQAGNIIRFKVGMWQLDTRIMEGKYPEVNHVIPARDSQPTRLTIDTKIFTKALTRVAKLASEKNVKMTVNGMLTLTSNDPDAGSAETDVPTIANNHSGDDLVIGFNAAYLLEALATKTEIVELGFSDPLSPLRIDLEDNRMAVIMPLRV